MLTSLQVRDQIKSKYQKHVFSKILCALSPYLVRWFSKSKSGFQASVESCEAEWKTKLDSATKVVILIIIIIFVIFITVIFFVLIIFNSIRSWLRLAGKRQVLRRRRLLLSKKSLRVQTLERWVWIVVLFAAVVVISPGDDLVVFLCCCGGNCSWAWTRSEWGGELMLIYCSCCCCFCWCVVVLILLLLWLLILIPSSRQMLWQISIGI